MPNIKSAKKRMITSEASRLRNKAVKTGISSARRQMLVTIESGDAAKIQKEYRLYTSLLDKAVKKGILTANTVNRRKSRIAARIKAKA